MTEHNEEATDELQINMFDQQNDNREPWVCESFYYVEPRDATKSSKTGDPRFSFGVHNIGSKMIRLSLGKIPMSEFHIYEATLPDRSAKEFAHFLRFIADKIDYAN